MQSVVVYAQCSVFDNVMLSIIILRVVVLSFSLLILPNDSTINLPYVH
jgi:hypothetical protein